MMHNKQTIFISYSWADATFAQCVRNMVQAAGLRPWIDFERLDLEQPLEPQLSRAISSTDWMILLDSSSARSSQWVQLELELANQMKKPIVQLPIEPSNCSLHLCKIAKLPSPKSSQPVTSPS
ncbi:toll/interleukin-1 receptor domain-containing protein [Candidatus Poriferisodalis sp.]|uniref:toll/interleukin-1 receptor domain-containing protein n=1 Tax=Candidatus Poriferisodalis sp. TaxID=3101277 RepID=UPI003B5258E7